MQVAGQGYVDAELKREGLGSVHDLLRRACAQHPDRPAFTCGASTLSFAALADNADAFARYLRRAVGLQPGDRLALQLPNCLQYTIAVFAAFKAGLVIVNTNPQYTPAESLHQFRDSGAKAVLLLDRLLPVVRGIQAQTELRHIILISPDDIENPRYDSDEADVTRFMQALEQGRQLPPITDAPAADSVAVLQYTGGTTGVSKGAMLTHRSLLANVVQTLELFCKPGLIDPATDLRIAPLPLYHIMAFATNCLCSVGMGLHTVFIRDGRVLDDVIGAMKSHPFSLLSGINTLFIGLMNHPEFNSIDFSHLKWVTSGGAPLNTEVGRRWQELTGAPVREGFGLTEASPVVATSTSISPYCEGYIGQPLIETELRTVDDNGIDAAPGEPGELWVRGPQVMAGYWQRPEDTAQVLTADGWLKTGDIAVLNEQGFMKIVDRKKDMILVSGFNVFPNEIEDVVMRHPGVRECIAVGVPDERKGEAVKIFVSLTDPTVTPQALLLHCRQFMTGYKLPSFVQVLEALPKSSVGKLLRRELRGYPHIP